MEGKCDAGLAGREGFYSRPVSIGILGDFTESSGNLAQELARLRGNGFTDDSLAPLFGQKNAPARSLSLRSNVCGSGVTIRAREGRKDM